MKRCLVNGCGKPATAKGLCDSHYARYKRHGNPLNGRCNRGEPMAFIRNTVASPTNECVLWPYSDNGVGYGRVWRNGKLQYASRVALELLTGESPRGMVAAHGPCNNPRCINPHPQHGMRWATPSGNTLDMYRDGTIPLGERRPNSKLTSNDVRKIRGDDRSSNALSRIYEVSPRTILNIRSYKTWRHV